jgi:hypothetical protein
MLLCGFSYDEIDCDIQHTGSMVEQISKGWSPALGAFTLGILIVKKNERAI